MDEFTVPETNSVDLFKEEFKFYKVKSPIYDLSGVQDFHNTEKFPQIIKYDANIKNNLLRHKNSANINMDSAECLICQSCGLNFHADWNVYGHTDIPGLIFITNPFTSVGQKMWMKKCLLDYPQKPNITNIDTITNRKNSNSFNKDFEYLKKLRWTTLGYHHNWDTKVYTQDRHSPFPSCLSKLSKHISSVLGNSEFQPEAAIINYYHLNSTLSGHIDCSERDLSFPLFSISFGQTAIFLIGGKTKSVRPTAMFLKSGDIVVMSKESRLCYHGIPRILQEDNKCKWSNGKDLDTQWQWLDSYIRLFRININVRQVLAPGQLLQD